MPPASTRRDTSGHASHVGLRDEARLGDDGMHGHDVEPRHMVGDEHAPADRRQRPRRRGRCRGRAASWPTTSGCDRAAPRASSRGKREEHDRQAVQAVRRPRARGAARRAGGSSAPRLASAAGVVGDARRRPACSARGPAARSPRTACAGCGWPARLGRHHPRSRSGANRHRSAGAAFAQAAGPSPSAGDEARSTAPGRWSRWRAFGASAEPCSPGPTSAPSRAAARARSRPARPRRTAAAWRPRRPACGR